MLLSQQQGSGGFGVKAGVVSAGGFSITDGVRKAAVTFTNPYADTNYSITLAPVIVGPVSYSPDVEDKTASGFTITLGTSSVSGLSEVGWQTAVLGG